MSELHEFPSTIGPTAALPAGSDSATSPIAAVRNPAEAALEAFRALIGDSLIYLAGSVALGFGNFLLVPLYTRHLTPSEFGIFALVDVTVLVLVTVTQLKLDVSYLKWFADLNPARHASLLGSVVSIGVATSLIGGGLLAFTIASSFGQSWLRTSQRGFAWMLLPIVVLENLQGLLLTDLRARRRPALYAISTVARLLAMVGATFWLVAIQKQGVYGVFLGRLAGDAVCLVLLACFCFRWPWFRFDAELLRPMIRYAAPLVWGVFMLQMIDASGRYFLGHYSTLEQVGLYGAALKISGVFQMLVTQPFGVAWGGLMFQISRWPTARLVYSKVMSAVFVLAMAGALVAALFTPTLFSLLASPAYGPAMAVLPLALLGRAIAMLEYPVSTGLAVVSQTKWFAVIYSAGLGITLIANYLLVPSYGMFGAAAAWLFGWTVVLAAVAAVGQRYYPIDYEWKLLLAAAVPWLLILFGYDGFVRILSRAGLLVQSGLAMAALLAGVLLAARSLGRMRTQNVAQ